MARPVLASLVLGALAIVSIAAQELPPPRPEPLELGVREEVDVQLVLVEVRVLDDDQRTVADLTADDFLLLVDYRPVEIATFDADCPLGAADDIRPGEDGAGVPAFETAQSRRIVLVFDYFHMENAAEAIEAALAGIDRWPAGGEQHMIVSLGQVTRVEAPFTSDREQLRANLVRMRADRALYAGQNERLTENSFFDRFQVLLEVLDRFDGRKMVVLFSGPFGDDGFFHDRQHEALASMAARARVAVYPVDTGGLRTPLDRRHSKMGGPPRLARIATETGGRMTSGTNDIAVAYARARRDLGCSYTLGFYDSRPRLDHDRRITVRVPDRSRLRVNHPNSYVVRSREKRRGSLARTASMAPGLFAGDGLRADAFAIAPAGDEKWNVLLGAEVAPGEASLPSADGEWQLRAYLRKRSGTLVERLERRYTFLPGESATRALFDPVTLRPGAYGLTVVLTTKGLVEPLATYREIEIGEVPTDRWFVVGPIVGRPVSAAEARRHEPLARRGEQDEAETPPDVGHPTNPDLRVQPDDGAVAGVAAGPGEPGEDEPTLDVEGPPADDRDAALPIPLRPLLLGEAEAGQPLLALTRWCRVGKGGGPAPSVDRRLVASDGSVVRTFESTHAPARIEDETTCAEVVDVLDTASLAPDRYRLEVSAAGTAGSAAEFTVRPAPP